MRAMTLAEQDEHDATQIWVRNAFDSLSLIAEIHRNEDVQVALARLRNWLDENEGRWVE